MKKLERLPKGAKAQVKAGDWVSLKPEVLKGVQEVYRDKPALVSYFAKKFRLASFERGRGKINYPKSLGPGFVYWYINENEVVVVKEGKPSFKGSCGCNWRGCKKEHAAA